MPAEDKEVEDAQREGIEFLFQNNIIKIIGSKNVEKIELIKTKLVQKEGEKRLSPVNIENSNYVINADYVVMALGASPEKFVQKLGIETNKWGNIVVDDEFKTSNSKIYASGDLAGVKGTVAWAASSGREAAKNILKNI